MSSLDDKHKEAREAIFIAIPSKFLPGRDDDLLAAYISALFEIGIGLVVYKFGREQAPERISKIVNAILTEHEFK